jgi:pimeloyl-ACP methyl ester carboxylesterase
MGGAMSGPKSDAGELRLAAIDVKPGAALESQSGLQMLRPRIWGAWREPAARGRVAAIVMHPASNFMGHYLIGPLAARGVACMGLNGRYAGNDTLLLMERVIQDLGAGVAFLREQGYAKVLLIGNSGGAALSSFYAAQSQRITATEFAHGGATHLVPADLPPIEGLALCAAHEGRSRLLARWIDPAVVDENDPLATDPALDLYGGAVQPPYDAAFLQRFATAQAARLARLETWVEHRLALLRSVYGAGSPAADQVFTIHRTHADPRCLDLSLDTNDRAVGSVWGDPKTVNASAYAMGRVSSLSGFLSQWSSRSQADGPVNLARCTHPVLLLNYSADQSTFPSTRDAWMTAAPGRVTSIDIRGGNHYLAGQPALVEQVADHVADFAMNL